MKFPFDNKIKTYFYISLWLVYAVLHTLAIGYVVHQEVWVLVVHSLIHAVLFGIIGFFLANIIRFGNYETLPPISRLFTYASLAVLVVVVWIALGYALSYLILGSDVAVEFSSLIALYVIIGILLYAVHVLYFIQPRQTLDNKEEEMETEMLSEQHASDEKQVEMLERVAVKVGQKIHVILLPDIDHLQSDGDYVQIHTADGRFLKEQTMKYFEEHLPSSQFVRIHRSCIVNVERIARIELYEKQSHLIILKNGQRIKVSTAGYKALRVALGL
jgi:Response regulator of the LytR/AlgR family